MNPTDGRPGREFDWQAIRERLARAAAATEASRDLTPEQTQAILEARARALARMPDPSPRPAEIREVVIFTLEDERYAIETRHIHQILERVEVTPIPGTPDFLVGIVNLRGEILAVFDLGRFFRHAGRDLTRRTHLIVLGGEQAEFGILADAVHEVRTLRTDTILEPPQAVAGPARQYLLGVTSDVLIVLDGAVLLHDGRLVIDYDDTNLRLERRSDGHPPIPEKEAPPDHPPADG